MSGDRSNVELLVVGGGIAGLSAAAFLRRRGFDPAVVERASSWRRVGYGVGLWGNGLAVLDRLGAADAVRDAGTRLRTFQIRGADGEPLSEATLPPRRTPAFLAVHRADLHEAIRDCAPAVRMDTSPSSLAPVSGGVKVTFEDGTTERYDAVVGADGVHSAVRAAWFDDWSVEAHDAVVWSFWVPEDAADAVPEATTSVWASGAEAFLVRIGGRALVNVAARTPRGGGGDASPRERLRAAADELGWILPEAVESLGAEDDLFFDRVRTVRADSWAEGRVCLVGDAAHALHPISGMGASMALEDAWVLARELADADADGVPAAMRRFELARRDRVASVRRAARVEAALTFAESSLLETVRNELVRRTPLFEWFLERQRRAVARPLADQVRA